MHYCYPHLIEERTSVREGKRLAQTHLARILRHVSSMLQMIFAELKTGGPKQKQQR